MLISRKVMVTFIMRLVQMRNCKEIELTCPWTSFIGQLIDPIGGGGDGAKRVDERIPILVSYKIYLIREHDNHV